MGDAGNNHSQDSGRFMLILRITERGFPDHCFWCLVRQRFELLQVGNGELGSRGNGALGKYQSDQLELYSRTALDTYI